MALEKEELQMLKATAPIYPTLLEKNKQTESAAESIDLVYRLNRTNDLLNELNHEKKHYETVYKKYKILHKILYSTQLACNSSSVISATCAAGGLVTGFGVVVAVPLGFFSVWQVVALVYSWVFLIKKL